MRLCLHLRLYTISRKLHLAGFHGAALLAKQVNFVLHGCDISPRAKLGNISLPHPAGVVIGANAIVEDNVRVMSGVVLGVRISGGVEATPIIRDSVFLGSGAKLLGAIEIGRCSSIGANCVVLESVPPHSTAVGIPARILTRKGS